MEILVNNEQTQYPIDQLEALVAQVVAAGLQVEEVSDIDLEVSITFVDDQQIHELNREYRHKDSPTDVLSFPQIEEEDFPLPPGMPRLLGDIVISLERAQEQSQEYGHSFQREVGYLTAHGLLHLLGYDHETLEQREFMRKKEEEVMNLVKLSRD